MPFGEYVPFRDALGFISELQQIPNDFDPGDATKVFDVKGTPVGTVICFESAFTPLMRDSVRDGAEAIVVSHQQPLVPPLAELRAARRARAR